MPVCMAVPCCVFVRLGTVTYSVLPDDVEQCTCGAEYTGLSCEVGRLPDSFRFDLFNYSLS